MNMMDKLFTIVVMETRLRFTRFENINKTCCVLYFHLHDVCTCIYHIVDEASN